MSGGSDGAVSAKALPWEDNSRLPETVLPQHYDLYLHPDLDTKLFSGNVSIQMNSTEVRDYFLIHAKNLNISGTELLQLQPDDSWQPVDILDVFAYTPNEFWVVLTVSPVPAGVYKVSCSFDGSLAKNGIVGFYNSTYVDENGATRELATTKFEPTYARQAFPCFDEPSFKSTFAVTVVRPLHDYIVLSNMPVASQVTDQPTEGLVEVTFERSVPMVTYLVCFIVSDFVYIGETLPSGMDFRVYAPRARVDNTEYALQRGAQILQFYEQMFDYPFPLPKSDMAAIPDYVSGATEHWGIITFRETSIFYNPSQSSESNKQRVCSVVAHELAHQWFGNLVTLKWWDDLWLNEGFASYIENKGVDHVEDGWDMASQFVTGSLQSVFDLDSKLSSHAIVQNVTTPDEITAMFDSISYDKGSSVLRMLESFVGSAVFQAGINSFLKRFAYQNAVTAQLWEELTKAWQDSGVQNGDVGEIMGTWTEQMGYPVINATRSADGLVITQERFLQDPAAVSDPSESPHGYRWHVPVSFFSSDAPDQPSTTWLQKQDESVTIPVPSGATWFKLNYNQLGYYRVNYDLDAWTSMIQLLLDKSVGPADRSSLYDDVLALADASRVPYATALDLCNTLSSETHLVPWKSATNRFPRIIFLLRETDVYSSIRTFVAGLTSDTYLALGWQDEGDHLQQLLRVQIVYLACIAGLEPCLEESARLLQLYTQFQNYPLPLSTKRQVLRQGMVEGGTDEVWQALWLRCVNTTQDATEKDNLLYGLANSQDVDTLSSYITLAQDESVVRTQDFLNVLEYISSNPAGTDLVWDWVRANWEWLVDRYTLNDRYLGQLIPEITQYFATQEKLDEMEAFFAEYPEAGAGQQYREQALETVQTNIRWVEANAQQIDDWLNTHPPSTTTTSAE